MDQTKIKQELTKRVQLLKSIPISLFPEQQKFVASPSKYKIAKCSRRSGKSTAVCYDLVKEAILNPGTNHLYVALYRQHIKKIAWQPLRQFTAQLGCTYNESNLTIQFPNGSEIWLLGADKPGAMESLRGIKLRSAVVDEAASFTNLEYLVDEVLMPTLLDLDGQLTLISTPKAAVGYFYKCWKDPKFAQFEWLTDKNPHIAAAALTKLKKAYNPNSMAYKREFQAEFATPEGLVYNYSDENLIQPVDLDHHWQWCLGLDFGVRDDSALVLVAYSDFADEIYITKSFSSPNLAISEIATKIKEMTENIPKSNLSIVYDSAALIYARELTERFNISLIPAKKQDKLGSIARVNSLLYNLNLKVFVPNQIINEWSVLEWNNKSQKERENPSQPNHLSDAALYALTYIHSREKPLVKDPPPREMDPWERQLLEQAMRREEERLNYKENGYDDSLEWS